MNEDLQVERSVNETLTTKATIIVAALFFAVMGVVTLVRPEIVLSNLGASDAAASARNEIRAVYGGFGLAMAGLIAYAIVAPSIRKGVLITVGVALLGMAAGRIVSLFVDGNPGGRPLFFFAVELVLGLALVLAGTRTTLADPPLS